MEKIYQFVWKNGHHLALLFCSLVSIILLLQGPNERIALAKNIGGRIFYPFQKSVNYVRSVSELKDRNRELGEMVMKLSREKQDLIECSLENKRLREMIDFKDKNPFQTVIAEVISVAGGRLQNSVTIDRGIDSGLRPRMPVVHSAGLVGRIFEVLDSHAVVQLLLDRDSRVSALVQRSRTLGIIQWREGNLLEMQKIHLRADVQVGDAVITSGFGGVFPKGIIIGYVTDVAEDEMNLTKKVIVSPAVDFDHLEEVFVVVSSVVNEIDEYRLSEENVRSLAEILGSSYNASKDVVVSRARLRILSDSTRADTSSPVIPDDR